MNSLPHAQRTWERVYSGCISVFMRPSLERRSTSSDRVQIGCGAWTTAYTDSRRATPSGSRTATASTTRAFSWATTRPPAGSAAAQRLRRSPRGAPGRGRLPVPDHRPRRVAARPPRRRRLGDDPRAASRRERDRTPGDALGPQTALGLEAHLLEHGRRARSSSRRARSSLRGSGGRRRRTGSTRRFRARRRRGTARGGTASGSG